MLSLKNLGLIHQKRIYLALRHYSSHDFIKITNEGGIRRITMTDIKTRNSLSLPMTECLLEGITKNNENPDLRCIIISALGDVFSAGHNLKHLTQDDGEKVFPKFADLMMAIIECPVPVITAVDGLAAAAGCQLVAQSDIAICTERSSFSTPGVNFGIFCSTPAIPLSRCIPRKLSAYMLFTGFPITAHQALQHGLVSKVASNGNLDTEVETVVNAIKAKSRSVMELGKKFFYEQMDLPLEAAYRKGTSAMTANLLLEDGKEGLKSFKEKRKPKWKHTTN
ncbi:hypothetical protein O3M35_000309 [Rhynocoris fuscipes]|uniref:Enoyl-CoA hydratase domain-containing protein 3, mitochondrial n=1 Tax=Rhynocoris fuscipes TaxID=488301 RepID=A0AAW1DN26_9HEMI